VAAAIDLVEVAIEADEQVRVVNLRQRRRRLLPEPQRLLRRLRGPKSIQGHRLEAWPDIVVRLTRVPVVSIASIRGPAFDKCAIANTKRLVETPVCRPM
jgi:hypothetical protein